MFPSQRRVAIGVKSLDPNTSHQEIPHFHIVYSLYIKKNIDLDEIVFNVAKKTIVLGLNFHFCKIEKRCHNKNERSCFE